MILTEEHLSLLRELMNGPMRAPNMAPETCEDLASAGYVTISLTTSSDLEIKITEQGAQRIGAIPRR